MGQPTAEQAAQRALDLGLLDDRQLQEVWATLGTRSAELNDLLQLLVRREYLTNYQVERLVKGERSGFFYGPYKVLYLVGAGTFARVFRAVHRQTGDMAAVKVLRRRHCENPVQSSQFVREGRLGCTLRHPNIVRVDEVISDGKAHLLVMEFVEGWNLRDFVRIHGKIEPTQAMRLMIGMTDGLRYAFDRGLTHRDLKMNNVLMTSGGQPKLVDFGLAAADESFGQDVSEGSPNLRTVDYAALEQATGVRKDDTRSDIYFMGCIFYNMLTGKPPLSETRDRLQRMAKSRFLNSRPIQDVAPGLPLCVVAVVNKAMSLEAAHRYQTPGEMLTDLYVAERQLKLGPQPGKVASNGSGIGVAGQKQFSVMIVEANPQMQDLFRNGLKRAGYRVLLTSDPERAVGRFRQDAGVADCVLFSAAQLGENALKMFNELGEDRGTHSVRAMLLLDEPQRGWEKRARSAEHRVVLKLPITMKQLRGTIATLVGMKVGT